MKINPESAELEQIDGHREFSPGQPVLFTHGMSDSMEFSLVNEARARELADYEARQRGTA